MSEVTTLKNIGKEIEKKLKTVGIMTAEELKDMGSEAAFVKMKSHYPNVCLVHLYSLEGAIVDTDYNKLPNDVRKKLKEFNDKL